MFSSERAAQCKEVCLYDDDSLVDKQLCSAVDGSCVLECYLFQMSCVGLQLVKSGSSSSIVT